MAGFDVTPEELDGLAKHITEINDQIQGQIRSVASTADGVAGGWGGAAATAFQNLMARFNDDAKKMQDALMAICEQIASTSEVYRRNEQEQEEAVSQIGNRLG